MSHMVHGMHAFDGDGIASYLIEGWWLVELTLCHMIYCIVISPHASSELLE